MSTTPKLRIVLAGLAALACLIAAWFVAQQRPLHVAERGVPDDEAEEQSTPNTQTDAPLAARNPGYAGISTCAKCHAARVEEFEDTRHFRACMLAKDSAAKGFAAKHAVHRTRKAGMEFHFSRTGQKLLVEGESATDRTQYEVGLVYGSGGERDEMYFAWQENHLLQLPVAWLQPQACWGNVQDRIEGREVPPNCLQCHNTWIAHVPGTINEYRREGMLLGVTCERCHGPAQEHVDYHRAHPSAEATAIVRPADLSRDRQMDLCAQCHSNVKPRGEPFSYRPGEPLEGAFRPAPPRHTEDSIVGNQSGALPESKCFGKSEMTCITCHEPHVLEKEAEVRSACIKCHTEQNCHEQQNLPRAIRGDCAGCHMPPRVWMNVWFHTAEDQYVPVARRTEHRIGIYPEATKAVLLKWLRTQTDDASRTKAAQVANELSTFWLEAARQRRNRGRLVATIGAVREALAARDDPPIRQLLQTAIARQTKYEELREQISPRDPNAALEKATTLLELSPHNAAAHSRLGSIYASLGKHDEAVEHLDAVAKEDPNDASGLMLLAWMAYIDGNPREAVDLNSQADEIEPRSAKIHFQWGLALLQLEQWSEAREQLEAALAIDPHHASASQGLSEALRNLGRASEAVRHARDALQWSQGQNPSMLLTLGRAYAADRQASEARRTLEQALAAAQSSQPNLLPAIEQELRQLR